MIIYTHIIINLYKVILLSTSSLNGYGLHRIFKFASKSGFDGLDLSVSKSNYDCFDEDYLLELIKTFNIPILSITAPSIGMNKKIADKIIDVAKKVGAQLITFSPPHFSDKDTQWFTKDLLKIKRESNLSISVQNVEPKFLFFIIPEYKNATLNEIKKITGDTSLDISSIDSSSGIDIIKAHKILGSSIKNIFISDRYLDKTGLLPGNAGGGISYLPIESFLMKLKTTGYNGFLSLKVKPNELGVGSQETVMQNLEMLKIYYKKHYLNYK